MKGSIYTRKKCNCGGAFRYDERRGDLFCTKCDTRTTGSYIVRMGKKHHVSFGRDIAKAEQHLSYIRCQLGAPEKHGKYDERDWKKHKPLSIAVLGDDWIDVKKMTIPSLSKTRMGMATNSIMRLVNHIDKHTKERLGDKNIKNLTERDLSLFYSAKHYSLKDPKKLLSSKSLYDTCMNLNEFFTWAAKIAGCDPIWFKKIGYESDETIPVSIQDQTALIEWLKKNCPEPKIWFAIEALARNANVRPSAFCAIHWEHINPIVGRIYVYKRKSRRKIKRGTLKPKIIIMSQEMMDYIKTLEWGTGPFMTYIVRRSGVKIGQRIHPKRLNEWIKEAGKALGIDTTLYAATKHTSVTGMKAYMDDEAIRRGFSQHATADAYGCYQHDHLSDQIRAQKTFEKMRRDAKKKTLKAVK